MGMEFASKTPVAPSGDEYSTLHAVRGQADYCDRGGVISKALSELAPIIERAHPTSEAYGYFAPQVSTLLSIRAEQLLPGCERRQRDLALELADLPADPEARKWRLAALARMTDQLSDEILRLRRIAGE